MIFQLVYSDRKLPKASDTKHLSYYIHLLILVYVPSNVWLIHLTFGQIWILMSGNGNIHVYSVKEQQYTVSPRSTFTIPDGRFVYIHIDIVGPLPPLMVIHAYSLVLTNSCIGQKLCSSGYYSCNNRQNIHKWMDFTFWNTHYHNWPWSTI